MTIGENLRTIRKRRGLDQVELARLAGVAQPSISLLETGRRGAQTRTLQKLADALNVPVAAFFAEDTAPKIPPPPKTRLASSTPEEIESKLFGAPAAQIAGELRPVLTEPQVRELSDAARRERDALELWIAAYTTASEAERFARRADYDAHRSYADAYGSCMIGSSIRGACCLTRAPQALLSRARGSSPRRRSRRGSSSLAPSRTMPRVGASSRAARPDD